MSRETMDDPELKELVNTIAPRCMLLLGACARRLVADYVSHARECVLTEVENVDQVPDAAVTRFDLGVVCGILEHLNPRDAGILIARLRDRLCQRVLLVVPIGEHWEHHRSVWHQTDLLAYGFTLLSSKQWGGRCVEVYGFDLATYKTTPDWLNANYWAHPELFDKYWW